MAFALPKQIGYLVAIASFSALGQGHAQSIDETDPRIQHFENGVIGRMDRGQPNPQHWTIEERLAKHGVPGVGVAVIEDGELIWAKGYGVKLAGTDDPIDPDTVFSVGSVSKMINAAVILRLAAEGLVDFDEDVNTYLTSWKVPDDQYTANKKVTLRAIMSHTAGFSQHGFGDFQPGEALPTAIQTLNGKPPAKHDPVRLIFEPGTQMDYSGGGVTVSQVLVEDVTGMPYADAARKYVFEPLGMTRSTFANPLSASHGNIARAHNEHGEATALPRGWEAMPELAASGLWISANDLATFVIALLDEDQPSGFLPSALREDMMTRVPRSWHGLGPRLNGIGPTRVFHHGGTNNSYRAWMEGHIKTGDGIVILTNGTDGHWIYAELRKAAEDAFDWAVKSDGGLEEPEF